MNPVCGIALVTVTRVVLPPFVFGEVEELTDITGTNESCAQPLILACCIQSPAVGWSSRSRSITSASGNLHIQNHALAFKFIHIMCTCSLLDLFICVCSLLDLYISCACVRC